MLMKTRCYSSKAGSVRGQGRKKVGRQRGNDRRVSADTGERTDDQEKGE
eukprot:gene3062-5908_t